MILRKLTDKGLISPPKFVKGNTHYLTYMGSLAYGCATEKSDYDVYGFCIPPKEVIFPHLAGKVQGFGSNHDRFSQWQQHHIKDLDGQKEYDFTIYNIVDYFNLLMQNNPNMLDSIFTPINCVIHCSQVGEMVRANRKKFLSKLCFPKLKGYAYSQLQKCKNAVRIGKRAELIEAMGWDSKSGSHVCRLVLECEQILMEGDLDLQRNNKQLIAIRNGEWTFDQLQNFFNEKERQLEDLYVKSNLQPTPNEEEIKELLLNCLEHHYGSLDKCVVKEDVYISALKRISKILEETKL